MADSDGPDERCTPAQPVDIRQALTAAGIEYLDVDGRRTIVIYRQAVLMVTATAGQATAAEAFDVDLWETPPGGLSQDPNDFLERFLESLLTAADTACVDA